jgi:hypothetical protein
LIKITVHSSFRTESCGCLRDGGGSLLGDYGLW